jgi:hypothetical protein
VWQPIKHQMRNSPHLPAILKLAQIRREMLRADVNVRPGDAVLQNGNPQLIYLPKALFSSGQ